MAQTQEDENCQLWHESLQRELAKRQYEPLAAERRARVKRRVGVRLVLCVLIQGHGTCAAHEP